METPQKPEGMGAVLAAHAVWPPGSVQCEQVGGVGVRGTWKALSTSHFQQPALRVPENQE